MTTEQFERACELFYQARELAPSERRAMLERACRDDPIVLREVESLLIHDARSTSIVESIDLGKGRGLLAADLASDGPCDSKSRMPGHIDKYRIIRQIGRGGMGIVYEAEQNSPRRRVALKVLSAGAANAQLLKRFKREADVLGQLYHPGIAKVFEAGIADVRLETNVSVRQPFFAMELIPGERLDAFVRHHAPDLRSRLELFAKICDAVHHAHERGVIHRDLKPGNIFVEPGGQPKVLDFGVARATKIDEDAVTVQTDAGQLIGTVPYMSPEQLSGDPSSVDCRSDIYSLGVCLYETLTGRLPYDVRGKLIHEAIRIVVDDEHTSLSSVDRRLAGDIETIVGKALEKDRSRRYQTADELGGDLRRFLRDEPISARAPSTAYQIQKFARRNRAFVTAAMFAAAALMAATFASTWWALTASRARQAESRQRRLADESAALARANEREMRRLAYSTTLSAALANIDGNPVEARRHLDLAPAELRGWEWEYLSHRIGRPAVVLSPPVSAAWDSQGIPIAAYVRDGMICVQDMRSGETLKSYRQSVINDAVSISPDASLIIAQTGPGRGAAIDAGNGSLRYEITGWPDEALPLFCEGNARFCLVRSGLRSLTFHDLRSGAPAFTVQLPSELRSVCPGAVRGSVGIYTMDAEATIDPDDGRLISDWHQSNCMMIHAFSADGTLAAEGANGLTSTDMIVRNLRDGSILQQWRPHTGGNIHVRFSPDGRYLMTNGLDDQLRIWDLEDRRQLMAATIGIARRVDFSPDGTHVLAYGDDGAFLLDWQHPGASRVLEGHTSYVYEVCYSPDGRLLASAGWDQSVVIHDTSSGALVRRLAMPCHHIGALGFSEDGTELAALAYDGHWTVGQLAIWSVKTGERVDAILSNESRSQAEQGAGSEMGDSSVVPVGAAWWKFAGGGSKATRYDGGEHMAKSHDGRLLAHARYKSDLVILNRETLEPLVKLVGHDGAVRAVAFSPDDRLLASGGDDRTVRVWEVATGRLLATMKGHSQKVFSVAFSPDGSRIVSGGNDNVIRFWDTATFGQVFALPGHKSYVHSLAFRPDGRQLASGSGDYSVRLWNAGEISADHAE